MAKAINWPESYRQYWLEAPADTQGLALRLGDLYFTNQYWVPNEIIDLRAGHKILRQAVVTRELEQRRVAAFTPDDYALLPPDLQSQEAVIAFLTATYGQPVTLETPVTLVFYRLYPVDLERVEK